MWYGPRRKQEVFVFRVAVAVFAAVLMSGACATVDTNFVDVETLDEQQLETPPYRIRGNDKLAISVFKQESISGEVLVRADGRITVALVGDIAVVGMTPPEASTAVAAALSATGFIEKPSVSVAVLETRAPQFAVLGEVKQPGSFELRPNTTVLDGIALSGGLTEFAQKERIFVVRKLERRADETPEEKQLRDKEEARSRVRFSFKSLSQRQGKAFRFTLRDGDVIVVE
jgi:polysaccharide export outer membrane protein